MNPQDDPEARIRDLERPLTDMARTSELGTAPYGYPPPTQPWPYGAPFPPAPAPRTSSGFRPWMVIVPIAVVLLAVGGGVAVYLMSSGGPTSSTAGRPTISGGGTITRSPGSLPSTPAPSTPATETPAPTMPGPSAPTATPGGILTVSGIEENKAIACDNSIVTVSGISNTVVITGHCASLTVSGIENVVTVDSADTISASGFENHVTYHTGAPRIDNAGGSNVVQQG